MERRDFLATLAAAAGLQGFSAEEVAGESLPPYEPTHKYTITADVPPAAVAEARQRMRVIGEDPDENQKRLEDFILSLLHDIDLQYGDVPTADRDLRNTWTPEVTVPDAVVREAKERIRADGKDPSDETLVKAYALEHVSHADIRVAD